MASEKKINGNYRIEADWLSRTMMPVPVYYSRMFNFGGRLSRVANVLVYIDKKELEDGGSARTFAYILECDSYFNVRLTTNHDASLAENADVVINGFKNPNAEFLEELESYDRLHLNVPKFIESISGYVRGLKQSLQEHHRVGSLEAAVA